MNIQYIFNHLTDSLEETVNELALDTRHDNIKYLTNHQILKKKNLNQNETKM